MEPKHGISNAQLQYRVRQYNHRFPGQITVEDLKAVIAASGCRCCWCDKADLKGSDLTFEHLENRNSRESLAVACFSCNASHIVGAKRKSDLSEEIKALREEVRHRAWERNHPEMVKAMRQAEYQRNKPHIDEYRRLNREAILAGYKRYYDENQDKRRAYAKDYTNANKERIREQRKQWRAEHPEEHASRFKEWYDANKERDRPRRQAYLEANREKILEAKRAAYQANAEQRRTYAKAYTANHRDEINAKKREKRALAVHRFMVSL